MLYPIIYININIKINSDMEKVFMFSDINFPIDCLFIILPTWPMSSVNAVNAKARNRKTVFLSTFILFGEEDLCILINIYF